MHIVIRACILVAAIMSFVALTACDISYPQCTLTDGTKVSAYSQNEGFVRARKADGTLAHIPWHNIKECAPY